MKILTKLQNLGLDGREVAVALGTFDGVHIGHQKIINHAVELAKRISGISAVFTFNNHPLSVLNPDLCPPQIISRDQKNAIISDLGVDILLTLSLTREFMQLSPASFIKLLVNNITPRYVVVGQNYSFGYKGAGTPDDLRIAGKQYSFQVEVCPLVSLGNTVVSSTQIRQYITEGDVARAGELLGRPYKICGPVIAGEHRGRILGFPTANIGIEPGFAAPRDGVYAVQVAINNKRYNGVANVGSNPTFGTHVRRIEIYVLDFQGDLYGQPLTAEFIRWIRDEQKFAKADDLKRRITYDIEIVRNILS